MKILLYYVYNYGLVFVNVVVWGTIQKTYEKLIAIRKIESSIEPHELKKHNYKVSEKSNEDE